MKFLPQESVTKNNLNFKKILFWFGAAAVLLTLIFLPKIVKAFRFRNAVSQIQRQIEEEELATLRATFDLRPLLLRLSSENGDVDLSLELSFAYASDDENLGKELTQRHAELHYELSNFISLKTLNEIDEEDEKTALKVEMRQTLNSLLTNGSIEKIYFNEFVFLPVN